MFPLPYSFKERIISFFFHVHNHESSSFENEKTTALNMYRQLHVSSILRQTQLEKAMIDKLKEQFNTDKVEVIDQSGKFIVYIKLSHPA